MSVDLPRRNTTIKALPMLQRLCKIVRWLLAPSPCVPPSLQRMFWIGVAVLALIGTFPAALLGYQRGHWIVVEPVQFERWRVCVPQELNQRRRHDHLHKDLEISKWRTAQLTSAVSDAKSGAFVDVRRSLSLEADFQRRIARDIESATIQPVSEFLPQYIFGICLIALFALSLAKAAANHGGAVIQRCSIDSPYANWKRPFWGWVALIFLTHLVREVLTSVFSEHKSWFAWSSFCISTESWLLMLAGAFGGAMIIAYPATVLWKLGDPRVRPQTLDVSAKDGRWGVGSYVLFLQTWSISTFVFLFVPTALWLRVLLDSPRLSLPYLIPTIVLIAAALLVVVRMVMNAFAVRRAYRDAVASSGATWLEIQSAKLPPDPTIDFLGEHWWNLPAIVLGAASALWLIFQMAGVSALITGLAAP